ncbi:MAG TPA: hypothetical protein VJQ82_18015 [Terriglobales bacterium]|nr:hypothetical protein [Terriglobales bacterium]
MADKDKTKDITDRFEKWWTEDGRMYDPDTDDVPWFAKRGGFISLSRKATSDDTR